MIIKLRVIVGINFPLCLLSNCYFVFVYDTMASSATAICSTDVDLVNSLLAKPFSARSSVEQNVIVHERPTPDLGPVHTYTDIFENGGFFLRFGLASTRKRRFR